MTIIAFPYAGGNKFAYNFLKQHFKESVNLEVFEYAGRGNRISEDLMYSVDDILDDLWPKVLKTIEKGDPYIIYGHSMGALVAFLLCHKIKGANLIQPLKLVVSGRKIPTLSKENKISDYPSEDFWNELVSLGGLPKGVMDEMALKDFFEPILRADFKAVEEFYFEKMEKLKIPMHVLYGDEELENENDFSDWKHETIEKITFHSFKGNHFFIHNHAEDIAKILI